MEFHGITIKGLGPFSEEVSLDIDRLRGPLVAVCGDNEVGKTTLLTLLSAGIDRETPTPTGQPSQSLVDLATCRDARLEVSVTLKDRYTFKHFVDNVSGDSSVLLLGADQQPLTDTDGNKIVKNGKVSQFDAWVKTTFPPKDVRKVSTFTAQGSRGVFDLGGAALKGVILRVRGVEKLEKIAKCCSDHAEEIRAELNTLIARIEDEQERGGDYEALERQLVTAKEALELAETIARKSQDELDAARADAGKIKLTIERNAVLRQKLKENQSQYGQVMLRQQVLVKRLADAQALLAERAEVEQAVSKVGELRQRIAKVNVSLARVTAELAELRKASAERQQQLATLRRSLTALNQRRETALGRLEEHEEILAERESIGEAVDKRKTIERELRLLESVHAKLQNRLAEIEKDDARLRSERLELDSADNKAHRRLVDVQLVMQQKADIEKAVGELPGKIAELQKYDEALDLARAQLNEITATRIAGADAREQALFEGHVQIATAKNTTVPQLQNIASEAIGAHKTRVEIATSYPERAKAAAELVDELQNKRKTAESNVAACRYVAEKKGELGRAAKIYEEVAEETEQRVRRRAAIDKSTAGFALERAELQEKLGDHAKRVSAMEKDLKTVAGLADKVDLVLRAETAVAELRPQIQAVDADIKRTTEDLFRLNSVKDDQLTSAEASEERFLQSLESLTGELTKHEPLAAKSVELTKAEAAVAEIQPQLESLNNDAQRLNAAMDVDVPATDPSEPDLTHVEQATNFAREEVAAARGEVRRVEVLLERAEVSAAKLADLTIRRRSLEVEFTDWTRLADDVGKNGMQALEVDAACPELADLTNTLLRECFGTRWLVSIETTRTGGKNKEIEQCEVVVFDSITGKRINAKAMLSGGRKVIIGEAVSLALTVMGNKHAGIERPTLIRDEAGAALSHKNAPEYVRMLRKAALMVNASKVFLVSHTPMLWQLADSIVFISEDHRLHTDLPLDDVLMRLSNQSAVAAAA